MTSLICNFKVNYLRSKISKWIVNVITFYRSFKSRCFLNAHLWICFTHHFCVWLYEKARPFYLKNKKIAASIQRSSFWAGPQRPPPCQKIAKYFLSNFYFGQKTIRAINRWGLQIHFLSSKDFEKSFLQQKQNRTT